MYWLLAMQLLAVLPLMAFASWAVFQLGRNNQAEELADLERRVAASADAVAREADRVKTRLQLLAAQPAARAGDVPALRGLAEQLMTVDASVAGVIALDRAGRVVLASHRPQGAAPQLPQLPAGAQHVFDHDTLHVSGLAADGLDAVQAVGFTTPWRVDGQGTAYALRLALKQEGLGLILRE